MSGLSRRQEAVIWQEEPALLAEQTWLKSCQKNRQTSSKNKMIFIRVHKAYRAIVAVCDSDLLGKKFAEGKRILNLTDFYKGDEVSEIEAEKLLRDYAGEDATFNIVGEKSVILAVKLGIIDKEGVERVEGVPFALGLM